MESPWGLRNPIKMLVWYVEQLFYLFKEERNPFAKKGKVHQYITNKIDGWLGF